MYTMLNVVSLGGNCWCQAILSRMPNVNFYIGPSSTLRHGKGIEMIINLFNGEFKSLIDEGICQIYEKEEWEKKLNPNDSIYNYKFGDYTAIHNAFDGNFITKSKKLLEFLTKYQEYAQEKDYYLFFYALNSNDEKYTFEELKKIKEEISKYININQLYILGQVPDLNLKENEMVNNERVRHPWNFRSDVFKKVFGRQYIETYPSNLLYTSAKKIYEIIYKHYIKRKKIYKYNKKTKSEA